jgi:hypothetical protein
MAQTSTRAPAAPEPRTASPAALAAGAVVTALARAARSFVLYDAGNAVIRQLLESYRDRTRHALDQHGELPLEVRPFEIALRGEVVFSDPDREKSLPFKLFRDGVRRITLLPSVTWEELLLLLQAVALRYTALRQQEDDIVTLLRKEDLPGLRLVVVEGFVPSEERPEPPSFLEPEKDQGTKPPEGWDTPLPRLPKPGPVSWRAVEVQDKVALCAEESAGALVHTALGLGKDLLAEAVRGGWPTPSRDLDAFFAELRDALLADGQVAALSQLVDIIGEAGAGEMRDQLLASLGDARTLELLLDGLPPGATELPDELAPLVPLLGVAAALDRIPEEQDASRRGLLLEIVLARLPREAEAVMKRLAQLEPGLARVLAGGLVARMPEKALEVARLLLGQRDQALRLEGLEALARVPGDVPLGPVVALLDDRAQAIRVKAIELLGHKGDQESARLLVRRLEERDAPPGEVEAMGRALAEMAPIPSSRLFSGWLNPRARFLIGASPQHRRLQWAAVAGLALLPGGEAERQLQDLAQRTQDELRKHCLAALARRRKGGQARG